MKVSLFLADAAQADAQSGKVHALGLGWRQCQTPTPPFALVMFLDIDWDETNKQHKLTCQLLNTDGQLVTVPGPQGPQRILFEAAAEAGRLPGQSTAPRFACRSPSTSRAEFPWNRASTSGGSRWTVSNGPRLSRHLLCLRAPCRRHRCNGLCRSYFRGITASSSRSKRRTRMLGSHGPTSAASMSELRSSKSRSTI